MLTLGVTARHSTCCCTRNVLFERDFFYFDQSKNVSYVPEYSNRYQGKQLRLGNDIVDLSLPYAKYKYLDQRFLKRVFTTEEQNSISNAIYKSKMFWAIWAAKEAAYKACKKKFPEVIFSHNKFIIDRSTLINLQYTNKTNEIFGIVVYKDQIISLRWQYYSNYVHATAVLLENREIFTEWGKINFNITKRSIFLDFLNKLGLVKYLKKYFTKRELSSIFSEESLITRFYAKRFLKSCGFKQNIEIIRSNGPPMLFIKEHQLIEHEISLSHDGNFMAVCCYTVHT